jgi:hypothetical protein
MVSLPKFLSAGNYAIWHKCRRIIRLEFWISVIVICLVFVFCYLIFFKCWELNTDTLRSLQHVVWKTPLRAQLDSIYPDGDIWNRVLDTFYALIVLQRPVL